MADRPQVPDLSCVKCGNDATSIDYCPGGCVQIREGRICGRPEHFHRQCRRCGYSWQTNDVLVPADTGTS